MMDRSETYMNVKLGKTESRSPSRAEPGVLYAEVNFKTPSAARVRTSRDGLNSIYSELNFREEERRIDDFKDSPISSGPGGLSASAQRGLHKQEPNKNFGTRPNRKICLLCLVSSVLFAIVVGLSIYVSQTRQSQITSERKYQSLWEQHQEMNRTERQYQQQVHELNSTLESRTSDNSRLHLSQRTCLKNLSALNNNLNILESNISALNSNLWDLIRTHSDLHHQFNQLKMKYGHINETKAQICQYLARKREPTCPQKWMKNEDRCYFKSEITDTYDGARQHCSELDSRLLEINSANEKNFVSNVLSRYGISWIGKCEYGNVASGVQYELRYGSHTCSKCEWNYQCNRKHRFICEKSAYLYPDIPEEIQVLCQQPVESTSIK